MHTSQRTQKSASRRGSALIISFMVIIALSFVIMRMTMDSVGARRTVVARGNADQANVAAEYGTELAVSALLNGLHVNEPADDVNSTDRGAYATVSSDWVMGKDGNATGQRFIIGTLDGQEFRVRVRSARQTFAADASGTLAASGWLSGVDKFDFDKDPLYKYSDVYEITAAAQDRSAVNHGAAPKAAVDRQGIAAVQSVVRLSYDSVSDYFESDIGPLFPESPQNLQLTAVNNQQITFADERDRGTNEYRPVNDAYPTQPTPNILVSGEDHTLNKYYVEDFADNKIITPLKLYTNEANYFGAYGGYWTNGCLTLNYQTDPENANPYRPKTRKFSTSANDRAMKVLDPKRDYDSYLLGGKESRTVTLNSAGVIIETSASQANEGGNFNIVLGAFEDLRNLYINMAGITASNSYPNDAAFEDTNQWFRMYIGQYTESARTSVVNSTSVPLYYGSRIRAQTLHVIKNEAGEVLVREYVKGSTRYNYFVSGSKWEGNYTWAAVTFGNEGFWLTKDTTKKSLTVPRVFMWQELVGYSLKKRANGQPELKSDGSKRTLFAVDGDGKRIPVGFDEEFQKSTSLGAAVADRFDVINVRQSDGTLKPHYSMQDFLFEKDFGTDQSGTRIKRKALAVFIGYEDQREHQADYNYTDMMFTIYIAPEEKRRVEDIATLGQSALHWWERDEREGLTGNTSTTPISTNNVAGQSQGMSSSDITSANFDLLGITAGSNPGDEDVLRENIYTMVTGDQSRTVFPRAYFEFVNGYSTGKLDYEHNEEVKKHWDNGVRDFYYARSDVVDFMQQEPEIWIDQVNGGWLMDVAVNSMQTLARGIGATLHYIDTRWSDDEDRHQSKFEDGSASFKVAGREITARHIAAQIIGHGDRLFPTIHTENYAPVSGAVASMRSFGLLAGEMVPALAENGYNPVVDGLRDSGDAVPHRTDEFAMPELDEHGKVRMATVQDFTDATPQAAVAKCYVDHYAGDPLTKAEVQEIYGTKEERYSIGFHRSGTDEKYKERHGQDHYEFTSLGVKGFNPHRTTSGSPDFVAMNKQADSTQEMNRYAIEYKYGADNAAGIDQYVGDHDNLGVPNFVFDKPIDGANAMVVNGNLVVRDTFAFYGMLVVLGDVVIIPTLKEDQFIYGAEGFPIDEYGNALRQDAGGWYYLWKNPDNEYDVRKTYNVLDINGQIVKVGEKEGEDETTPGYGTIKRVSPLREKTYRGQLVVQGSLIAKGRIRTMGVENVLTGNTDYGRLTAIWSSEAIQSTGSGVPGAVTSSRVSWSNDKGVNADELWQ